tara:strand:- start:809 stop:1210 length:402 start_codon:yes stop_codon:yes gene_type:complete
MKITKSELRKIIREEIQKEAAFGTAGAPISGTRGLSFSGSRTAGRPKLSGSPEPEEQYPNLARLGFAKQKAYARAFGEFELENDKLPAGQKLSDEKMKKIKDDLYKDTPFGGFRDNEIYKRTLDMLRHELPKG